MEEKKKFLFLILIMAATTLIVAGISIYLLYQVAFNEEQERLIETAQSQARLIESVARYDSSHQKNYHQDDSLEQVDTAKITLAQIIDSHNRYTWPSKTGEFTLARRDGDKITFLLAHRHYDRSQPKPVPFDSHLAEPMRRALLGLSGTIIGLDYRGETVLAAYEPVAVLNYGIVAKIDLKEIRAPFFKAILMAAVLTIFVVGLGTTLFLKVSNPMIRQMAQHAAELEHKNDQLQKEIQERKSAENKLATERQRLNVTLRSIGDGVITTDLSGNITLMNGVAEELTGWNNNEAVGKPIEPIFHIINEKTRKPCENPVEKVLEKKAIIGLANDTVLVTKDGKEKIIADSGAPILDEEGKMIGVVLVFRDITEKVAMEVELRQAHKMEAIGTLAGGIAHDFNNILGIIMGNTELSLIDIPEGSPVHQNLAQIRQACIRARDVVRQLLSFSRKTEQTKRPIKVLPIIEESLKLLRSSIPTNIDIRHKISNGSITIMADPTQIHQIILNLFTNAADAMAETGGVLELELSSTFLSKSAVDLFNDLTPGEYLKLSVSDTGNGIPEHLKNRIFDPYFTTKAVGKGTGMGLAVVHGIVRDHQGWISVRSNVAGGSTFEVLIPMIEGKAEALYPVSEKPPTGTERILFVDDEEAMVRLGKQGLEKLGYHVEGTTSAKNALDLFKSEPDKFDLIITDMTMPGINGDRLAKEIKKIRPHTPIILCTGYSEGMSETEAKSMGINAFFEKPASGLKIAEAVRTVLDEVSA